MKRTIKMGKNSSIEDALFQIRNLEEALNKNAQGILSSTMKQEIKSLVKESLKEQDDEVEDDEEITMDDEEDMDDEEIAMDDEEGMDDEEDMDDEEEYMDDEEGMDDMPEPPMDDDEFDMEDDETIDLTGASDAEVIKVFKLMSDNDGIVVTKDENNISFVDGEDEYLIKLNEEIEEDMNTPEGLEEWMDSKMDENIYEISMDEDIDPFGGGDDYPSMDEDIYEEGDHYPNMDEDIYEEGDHYPNMDEDIYEDIYEEGDNYPNINETIYEISMDEDMDSFVDGDDTFMGGDDSLEGISLDEIMYESKSFKPKGRIGKVKKVNFTSNTKGFNEKRKEAFGGSKVKAHGTGKAKFEYKKGENMDGDMKPVKKVEAKEASRFVKSIDRKVKRNLMAAPKQIKEEVEMLREKNEEYKKALDLFRTKLNEVAVFNSNLAYATRLFTEHSTTKQEKINILRRFDDVETLKESKNLYRSIKNELSDENSGNTTSINESIERTVNKTVSSGSAVNLIESKTYENPQFLRMKDLMTKIK